MKKSVGWGLAAALVMAGWAWAQDEVPAEAGAEAAPAEEAAAAEEAPAEEAAAEEAKPAIPVKPRPSDILPLASRGLLLDVTSSGKHLFAVGARGNLILSNDGKAWAQVQTPIRAPLTAITFTDDQNGWAVGHDATIINTSDGGKTWKLQNFQPELEKPFLDVLFLDATTGFAVGAYGLFYKTSDGGTTWTEADAPAVREAELHLNAIAKLANGSLVIVGEQGTAGLSSDGGNTWEKLTTPYEGSFFGALPLGEGGALLFGMRGNVLTSADPKAGVWTQVDTGTVASFYGGTSLEDGRVALVGIAGAVMLLDVASGSTQMRKIRAKEKDRSGVEREKIIASTISSTIPFGSGLLVVGEEGARYIGL